MPTRTSATRRSQPRHRGAHHAVIRHILANYHAGDQVPGAAVLSDALSVSGYAATRALNEMSSQGLLVREPGRGSFMTAPARQANLLPGAGGPLSNGSDSSAVKRIAYVAGDLAHSGLSLGLLVVLNQELAGTGVEMAVRSTGEDSAIELAELRHLPTEGFAGAIVNVAETPENLEQLRELRRLNFPVVLVDRERSDDDHGAQVAMDHFEVARLATERLAEAGHRRIAFIGHTPETMASFQGISRMAEGYRSQLEALGLPVMDDYIKLSPPIYQHRAPSREEIPFMTYIPMNQLLRLEDPPTAVVTLNGYFALGAMLAARDAGLRVPSDISFAGISGVLPDARRHGLPYHLSGSGIRLEDLGRTALRVLRRLMTEGCSLVGGCRTLLAPAWQDGDTISGWVPNSGRVASRDRL